MQHDKVRNLAPKRADATAQSECSSQANKQVAHEFEQGRNPRNHKRTPCPGVLNNMSGCKRKQLNNTKQSGENAAATVFRFQNQLRFHDAPPFAGDGLQAIEALPIADQFNRGLASAGSDGSFASYKPA